MRHLTRRTRRTHVLPSRPASEDDDQDHHPATDCCGSRLEIRRRPDRQIVVIHNDVTWSGNWQVIEPPVLGCPDIPHRRSPHDRHQHARKHGRP